MINNYKFISFEINIIISILIDQNLLNCKNYIYY